MTFFKSSLVRSSLLFLLVSCGQQSQQNKSKIEQERDSLPVETFSVTGAIENYQAGAAEININGFMLPKSTHAGSIDNTGTFKIDFPTEFSNRTDSLMQAFNENAQTYRMSRQTVEQYFLSQGSDSLKVEHGQAKIALAGGSFGFQLLSSQGDTLGSIYPMSSSRYMSNLFTSDLKNVVPGYHLAMMHVDTTATVHGDINQENFAEQTSYQMQLEYDIDLQKGWNIIKHSMDTLHIDGSAYPSTFTTETIKEIPEDLDWIFLPKNK